MVELIIEIIGHLVRCHLCHSVYRKLDKFDFI